MRAYNLKEGEYDTIGIAESCLVVGMMNTVAM